MSRILSMLAVAVLAASADAAVVPDRWLWQATTEGVAYREVCQIVRADQPTRLEHVWIDCGGMATAGRIDLALTVREFGTFTLLGSWGGWIDAEFASRWFGIGASVAELGLTIGPDEPLLIGLAVHDLDGWDGMVGPRLVLDEPDRFVYLDSVGNWLESVNDIELSVGWIGEEIEASEAMLPEPWTLVVVVVLAVASRV